MASFIILMVTSFFMGGLTTLILLKPAMVRIGRKAGIDAAREMINDHLSATIKSHLDAKTEKENA